ncbi:restriction endonuclease subunit S [Laribacter hongkongensis]|uniref:restriction endonuclease subunit S n=1 Tax=Laribacter hongkongensis TaxID=168471 RepID=UPI001EFD6E52|nr:restriction endonuclease subunit S [Laribacter hongkongensis]MCG9042130.1 restriction endonuclease subunit S [Laribacter hongkongensis]MCG9066935.1 restriction endonuclease subunit S [Laribacter hongkongensis]
MQRYESYKPSGVKWLGDVPAHWEIRPGFTCFKENKDRNKGLVESTVLSLSYGRIVIKPEEKLTGLVPESFEGYQLIKPGDIVIRTTDLQNDQTSLRVGYAKDKGMITSAYLGLRCHPEINPEYVFRLLESYDALKVFYGMGSGLRQNIDFWDFKRLPVPLPPRDEQDRIVAFLEQKTAEIDAAIAKKERLIKLLVQQKDIQINHVVTYGLDPDVPLKDSGLLYTKKMPEHWLIKKVKHVSLISPSKTLDGRRRTAESVCFLPMERIGDDGTINSGERKAANEIFDGFTYFRKGDVVIAKITPCFENGKGAWLKDLPTDYGFGTTELHVFRPTKIYGDFLFRLLNRKSFLTEGEEFMVGSAGQKRIPTSFIANYLFACPPIEEQRKICVWISELCAGTELLIRTERDAISRLTELKKVLISSAVTGLVKV